MTSFTGKQTQTSSLVLLTAILLLQLIPTSHADGIDLQVEKRQIVAAMEKVAPVLKEQTMLEILKCALLEASDNTLTITATNLDSTVRYSIPADVGSAGAIALPAKAFAAALSATTDPIIHLSSTTENAIELETSNSKMLLSGLNLDEFPPVPSLPGGSGTTLESSRLVRLFEQTRFASSTDPNRYVLNGVLLENTDGKLIASVTDGRRLVKATETPTDSSGESDRGIVPINFLNTMLPLFEGNDSISIRMDEENVFFTTGSTQLISKVIEGNYPNVEQVIPNSHTYRIVVPRLQLRETFEKATLIHEEEIQPIKLVLTSGKLSLVAESESGRVSSEVKVDHNGEDLTISVSSKFALDALDALDTEDVTIDFIDSKSPLVIRSGDRFLYVLMPLRTL